MKLKDIDWQKQKWGSLVEGDEQPDRTIGQTWMEYVAMHFFRLFKTPQLTT